MAKLRDMLDPKPPDVPDHPPCAFCGSEETKFMSLFGQFLLVSQYYCRNCHSVFEWCKWQEEDHQEGLHAFREKRKPNFEGK